MDGRLCEHAIKVNVVKSRQNFFGIHTPKNFGTLIVGCIFLNFPLKNE